VQREQSAFAITDQSERWSRLGGGQFDPGRWIGNLQLE
jgi:hypothetical protein